jgi:prephenate dehydrogenase
LLQFGFDLLNFWLWLTMNPLNSVVIYGVGLIGGSVGMALRKRGLVEEVIGVGRSRASLDRAVELGALDRGCLELEEAVASADLVLVATPVDQIVSHIAQIRESCPDTCLVTDAGSTKSRIVQQVEQEGTTSGAKGCYIGSHPLAGSEQSGVEAASADLFSGRSVILTPLPTSPMDQLQVLQKFWEGLGARVGCMSPEEHDEALAQTSHLPHTIASALAASTPDEWLTLTATGWRDTTRIASGDVGLWVEILMQNRDDVLVALERFKKELTDLEHALSDSDKSRLSQLLTTGKQRRDSVGN